MTKPPRYQTREDAGADASLEFRRKAAEWHAETDDLASVARMVSHPAYLRIINIGKPVLPLILEDLRDNGGFWFPALEAIAGASVGTDEERANFRLLRQAWLRWGESRGLLA